MVRRPSGLHPPFPTEVQGSFPSTECLSSSVAVLGSVIILTRTPCHLSIWWVFFCLFVPIFWGVERVGFEIREIEILKSLATVFLDELCAHLDEQNV